MSGPPAFDASQPAGGNRLEVDVNAQYAGREWHSAYLATCAFVVWPILPGLGLLYGGLARRRSALALLLQSLLVGAVVAVQWMFWGYSLAHSRTAGPFVGDLAHFGLRHVMAAPSPGNPAIPEVVFCFYQLLFCACTVQIVLGGAFERGRILPSPVFGFWWATVVYCPVACRTWNAKGWLYKLPSLDFAGGGPVHIASGWSALAYALVPGKRRPDPADPGRGRPHNTTLVFLGAVLIWFGWFGFNGGSALNASIRSIVAVFNTNAAACAGVLGWVFVDYPRHKRRFSIVGACEGAIAGLVGITPAAGFVSLWLAAVIGLITGVVCCLLEDINDWLHIDEGMDVFKLHGVGGMVGAFLTGIFADQSVSALDGVTLAKGAINGEGVQVGRQFAAIAAISAYSFLASCALLLLLEHVPGLHLRVPDEAERRGLDLDQFFDEQIGDWGLPLDARGIGMQPETVLGRAPARAGSSSDDVGQGKGLR